MKISIKNEEELAFYKQLGSLLLAVSYRPKLFPAFQDSVTIIAEGIKEYETSQKSDDNGPESESSSI